MLHILYKKKNLLNVHICVDLRHSQILHERQHRPTTSPMLHIDVLGFRNVGSCIVSTEHGKKQPQASDQMALRR